MDHVYVLIFNSVHRVMHAEKLLKQAGVTSRTIPVPRKLSSDCGLAIRIAGGRESFMAALADEMPEELYIENGDLFDRVGVS